MHWRLVDSSPKVNGVTPKTTLFEGCDQLEYNFGWK